MSAYYRSVHALILNGVKLRKPYFTVYPCATWCTLAHPLIIHTFTHTHAHTQGETRVEKKMHTKGQEVFQTVLLVSLFSPCHPKCLYYRALAGLAIILPRMRKRVIKNFKRKQHILFCGKKSHMLKRKEHSWLVGVPKKGNNPKSLQVGVKRSPGDPTVKAGVQKTWLPSSDVSHPLRIGLQNVCFFFPSLLHAFPSICPFR